MTRSAHEFLHPKGWKPTPGYACGIAAEGRMIFLGGLIGWNADQEFETDDFAGQVKQVLENVVAVLATGGARPEHITRMTWYITDKREYLGALKEIGAAYKATIGRHYPAMALVQVVALLEDRAKVEIEVTAVVPNPAASKEAQDAGANRA
ncbi:MAG: RidA family protein [Albidovulum sp.]